MKNCFLYRYIVPGCQKQMFRGTHYFLLMEIENDFFYYNDVKNKTLSINGCQYNKPQLYKHVYDFARL